MLLTPNLTKAEEIETNFTPILPKGKCLGDSLCLNNTFCDLKFWDQFKTQKLKAFCQTSPNCNLADDLVPSDSFTIPLCVPKIEIGKECYKNEQCSSNNCGTGQGGEKKCMDSDTGAGYLKFSPIAPTLEIKIPTLQPFTTEGLEAPDAEGNIYFPFIGQYIVGIYKWMLLVAGIVATIMIILGGFTYLTSGGNATRAGEGKERITSAIFGLILLLGSYMLLYLINPGLVEFRSLKIKIIERKELDTTMTYLDMSGADTLTPGEGTSAFGVPLFKQYNYPNVPYGSTAGESVKSAGCGPTSLAMILKYYNFDTDPGKLATIIMQNKNEYIGQGGTKHNIFTDQFLGQFGFQSESLGKNMEKIIAHLKEKHPILAGTKTPSIFTKKGHFIVITGINANGSFSVNDSNKSFYCTKEEINFPKYFPDYPANKPQPTKDQSNFAALCQKEGGQFIMPNAVPAIEITNALTASWFIYP